MKLILNWRLISTQTIIKVEIYLWEMWYRIFPEKEGGDNE